MMTTNTLEEFSAILQVPLLDRIETADLDAGVISRVPLAFMKEHRFVVLRVREHTVEVATAHALNLELFDDIARLFAKRLSLFFISEQALETAWGYLAANDSRESAESIVAQSGESEVLPDEGEDDPHEDLLDLANKPPIIRVVNMIMLNAITARATDIHIQPSQDALLVRYRVDGLLYEAMRLPVRRHAAIVSRIKIMSRLDISEQRLPQDGRTTIKAGSRSVDIRVSTMPTSFGEKAVLRILDKNVALFRLEDLGISEAILPQFRNLIRMPNGMIFVVGPTGSGKTTTLYAALNEINTPEKNIITVEDPIEYYLPGVCQTQVKPRIGLSFAAGLRSFLRQDPDIIMVGEIRDSETAAIAVQASLTGHLVFSTLHTNNASEAITRLLDLEIEPYLLGAAQAAFLAQRLVRKICPACSQPDVPDIDFMQGIGLNPERIPHTLRRGRGCAECMRTGYKGRVGIFELLEMDEPVREAILSPDRRSLIRRQAGAAGMRTLFDDGWDKVCQGLTTLEEIVRVTRCEVTNPDGVCRMVPPIIAAGNLP